jgi:hypothetical protein
MLRFMDRLRCYVCWVSFAVWICAFVTLVWAFETAPRQPDALHPHEFQSKSRKRYLTNERKQVFDVAAVALGISGVLMFGLMLGQARRDRKQRKNNPQQQPPSP